MKRDEKRRWAISLRPLDKLAMRVWGCLLGLSLRGCPRNQFANCSSQRWRRRQCCCRITCPRRRLVPFPPPLLLPPLPAAFFPVRIGAVWRISWPGSLGRSLVRFGDLGLCVQHQRDPKSLPPPRWEPTLYPKLLNFGIVLAGRAGLVHGFGTLKFILRACLVLMPSTLSDAFPCIDVSAGDNPVGIGACPIPFECLA